MFGDKAPENSEVTSNESGSKSHRTPLLLWEGTIQIWETWSSLQKKSGPKFQLRGVGNMLMVTGSDWFQLFSPKGVQPNIKMRVPMIFSDTVFEFCVKWCQIGFFSSAFLCCPNVLKGNNHMYTKTFEIATLFWEKWCIFWKSSRGANTFVHDCISVWTEVLHQHYHPLSCDARMANKRTAC